MRSSMCDIRSFHLGREKGVVISDLCGGQRMGFRKVTFAIFEKGFTGQNYHNGKHRSTGMGLIWQRRSRKHGT